MYKYLFSYLFPMCPLNLFTTYQALNLVKDSSVFQTSLDHLLVTCYLAYTVFKK